MQFFVIIFSLFYFSFSFATECEELRKQYELVDRNADCEVVKLRHMLATTATKGFLFGHQNADVQGHSWYDVGEPDVLQVSNEWPAFLGYDFVDIEGYPARYTPFYRKRVMAAFERGNVISFSWHMGHPITRQGSMDLTSVVDKILPGEPYHHELKWRLDLFADFMSSLKTKDGKMVPIIFRPWHEHNGKWFWWSARFSEAYYKKLWRYTVSYLRDERGLRNLLYAYSPDKYYSTSDYLFGYPGDDMVDIFGMDLYIHSLLDFKNQIGQVVSMAKQRKKLVAITETGVEGIPNPKYWTQNILIPYKNHQEFKGLSYIMFWRNASERASHYYVPFPGHPSANDFVAMAQDMASLFLSDLRNLSKM